jgi:hypothetical protein
VLALVVAEVVCRIDRFFPGRKYASESARMYFAARADASEKELEQFAAPDPTQEGTSLRAFAHPFLGWSDERSFATLAEGDAWYATAESRASFDVLLLGGSVAADFGNRGSDRLIELLGADPRLRGRDIRIWNEGHAGYKAPQPLHVLEWILSNGHEPDAIVIIDGFNEVAIASGNHNRGVSPLYPFAEHWDVLVRGNNFDIAAIDLLLVMRGAQKEEQAIARSALSRGYHRSALLTRLTLSRLADRRRAFEKARDAYLAYVLAHSDPAAVRGPRFAGDRQAAIELAVQCWSESARTLHTLCAQRGIAELHVLQPARDDPGTKQLTADEMHSTGPDAIWTAAVLAGYPLLKAAGAALAESGIPFADATRVFEGETGQIYIDLCHFNDRGNVLLAELVAPRLLAQVR